MADADSVETFQLGDLVAYSDERRVRSKICQTDQIVSELVCYEGGQGTKQHVHPHQDEIFTCIDGDGVITFADPDIADRPISKGSVVLVPAGIRHGVSTEPGNRLVLMFTKGPGVPNPHRVRNAEREQANG